VVDGSGLENRRTRKGTGGSNPSLSATTLVTFLHKGAVKQSAEASVRGLLENAITVSQQVLASCQRRGWTDRDVSNLEAAAQRGVEALRSLKGPAWLQV
jgi:hypothetical protein